MAPRPLGPFIETPGSYGGNRPKSRWLWLPVLLLLAVVFAFVFRIIPQGPVEVFSDRGARKMLAEAELMENQSLNVSAAMLYTRVAENNHISPILRIKAARGMARVYREIPGHTEDVEHGLEIAYSLTPTGEEKEALRDELEHKRGRPLTSIQTRTPEQADDDDANASATLVTLPPLPKDANILANIGDESVSMQEILYAWRQSYGPREPSPEELKQFVRNYLDLVLLADEARRQGIDRQPDTTYDLRLRRIMGLNQALTTRLISALKTPDAKALEDYYNKNQQLFTTPERVLIGHIVVQTPDDEAKVTKALGQGQRFDKVAVQFSVDAKQLQGGYLLGWISRADATLPGMGYNPILVGKMLAMADGDTTGPIRSQRGVHWLRVVNRTPPKLRPFKEVQEDVMLAYQKTRLAEDRLALLKQLHQNSPIDIVDPDMRAEMENEEDGEASVPLAPADASAATTATQPAAASTAAPEPTPAAKAATDPGKKGSKAPEGKKKETTKSRTKKAA
jgi:hypothetical protein